MTPRWVEAAEAMLEGARMLPECSEAYWRDADGEQTFDRSRVAAACAYGAAAYARHWPQPSVAIDLCVAYAERFDSELAKDNDHLGRDYVLANVKEMLNEAAA